MNHHEWKTKYTKYHAMAARIVQSRYARAEALCKEAGLSPSLLGVHPHNALMSYKAGKPWPNVDYSKVRECIRVMDSMSEPGRILAKWDRRVRSK